MTDKATLQAVIDRLEAGTGADNALDVAIEVALFEPTEKWKNCRANAAATKVIYTDCDGKKHTHWAADWTDDRDHAIAQIKERMKDD
jgi:uncharacterized Ntn-hydrolase superfamily protein